MHTPLTPYATAPAWIPYQIGEIMGPDLSSGAGVRLYPRRDVENTTDLPYYNSTGHSHNSGAADHIHRAFDHVHDQWPHDPYDPRRLPHSHSAANANNLGTVNPSGVFEHVHDQWSHDPHDPRHPFPDSHSAAIANNLGTINPSGALGPVSDIVTRDDDHLNGFNINGTYPQPPATAALLSSTANSVFQTDDRVDPHAVYRQRDLAGSELSMNGFDEFHLPMTENEWTFAASNPLTLDPGHDVPAVITSTSRLMNVDQDASAMLTNYGFHFPTAPRVNGERRAPASRGARG
ncbi:hypothetical protein MMC07_005538 [Pseudocyphellaria aurata]|nr:hypothetical protein [Pseudocyphellaria aurata]